MEYIVFVIYKKESKNDSGKSSALNSTVYCLKNFAGIIKMIPYKVQLLGKLCDFCTEIFQHTCMHAYIYIYIERERERESINGIIGREGKKTTT